MAKSISILLLFLCVSYAIGNDAPAVQNEDNGIKFANEIEDASKLQNDEEYDQALDLDEGAQSEEDGSNFEAEETTEADEQGEEALAEDDNAEENDDTEVASNEDTVNEEGCTWRLVYVPSYYNQPLYQSIRGCHPVRRLALCCKYVPKPYYKRVKRKGCYYVHKKKACKYLYTYVRKIRYVKKCTKCARISCKYPQRSSRYLSGYAFRTRYTRKRLCI